jgi:2-phospho-L-lactate guanylyltransferase
LIVSRSPEAHALAQAFDTERFSESPGCNLSESLTQAGQYLDANFGIKGVVVIPADLPLLRLKEIDDLLEHHDTLTLAPDQDGIGTNALAATPWNLIPFNFNEKSFIPHADAGFKAGITPVIIKRPGFSLDVDTPQDLLEVLQHGSTSQTANYLNQSGIAQRLQEKNRITTRDS